MVSVLSNLAHLILALPIMGGALLISLLLGYQVGGWSALLFPVVVLVQLPLVGGLALGLGALNVHFKDVKCHAEGHWEIVGQGDVDWSGQIAALIRDGYEGAIAAEPHLAPSVASTRNALTRIRACMNDANRELSTK